MADPGVEAGHVLDEPGTSCHTREKNAIKYCQDPVKRTQESTYEAAKQGQFELQWDNNYNGWKTANMFKYIIYSLKNKAKLAHFCRTIGNFII